MLILKGKRKNKTGPVWIVKGLKPWTKHEMSLVFLVVVRRKI